MTLLKFASNEDQRVKNLFRHCWLYASILFLEMHSINHVCIRCMSYVTKSLVTLLEDNCISTNDCQCQPLFSESSDFIVSVFSFNTVYYRRKRKNNKGILKEIKKKNENKTQHEKKTRQETCYLCILGFIKYVINSHIMYNRS